jgi:hypothetical protein
VSSRSRALVYAAFRDSAEVLAGTREGLTVIQIVQGSDWQNPHPLAAATEGIRITIIQETKLREANTLIAG